MAMVGLSQLALARAYGESKTMLKSENLPWMLRHSEAFEFTSEAVGDRMAVGVWSNPRLGSSHAADEGTPLDVIYVLDGSFMLGMAATICQLLAADAINPGFKPVLLVGVDYLDDNLNARMRDYTMKDSIPANISKMLSAGTPQTTPGGADNFLKFLENELDPAIRSKYRTTNAPAGIIGDSFGATFTFYAFLKQSKLFDKYWLGSPAIFSTESNYMAQFEGLLKSGLAHPAKMFLSMGSKEMAGGIDLYDDIGKSFNHLLSALRRNVSADLTWSSKVYDGYTHTSVLTPALNDALLYLYGSKPA
jgi:predicted alpha/beta superfamily hydrolase